MTVKSLRAEIRLGDWDLMKENDCQMSNNGEQCAPPYERVFMETATIHPDYARRFQYSDDIALIRLTEELNLRDLARELMSMIRKYMILRVVSIINAKVLIVNRYTKNS